MLRFEAAILAVLAAAAALSGGCSNPEDSHPGDAQTDRQPPRMAADSDAARTRAAPPMDSALLHGVVDRRIVIYIEATPVELEEVRAGVSEDFSVIADDLMYYRSMAWEYLEGLPYDRVRIAGRRPISFLVSGVPRMFDFAEIELLDVVIAYEPGQQPRVIAPNAVESVLEYFGTAMQQ
jgi:hypothetical protein